MRGAGGLHLGPGGSVRTQAMIKNLKTNLFITDGSIAVYTENSDEKPIKIYTAV